jgi:1-acyl-sn-glycerol-3-phosphate acyltransferase
MRYPLLFLRLIAFVVLTLGCTFTVVIGRLVGQPHTFSLAVQQFWSVAMLWSWGVRTVLHGTPPNGGLIMANHQSYLDIWMIPKYCISVFVAKAEVRRMALVGWGASSVNTVYVDRTSKDSRSRTRAAIADRLRRGRSVIIFPEGTTHFGKEMLPLKPGMFYAAAEEDFPIIPVAIAYKDDSLAWVGDEPIGRHFFRNFGRWSTVAHIHYGEPIRGNDPEAMMLQVKEWIEAEKARMLAL